MSDLNTFFRTITRLWSAQNQGRCRCNGALPAVLVAADLLATDDEPQDKLRDIELVHSLAQ